MKQELQTAQTLPKEAVSEEEFYVPIYINQPLFQELGKFMRAYDCLDLNEMLSIVFDEFEEVLAQRIAMTPDRQVRTWMQEVENGPLPEIEKALERQNLAAMYPEEAKKHGLKLK